MKLKGKNRREYEIPNERINVDGNTILPNDYNPHSVRPWIIGNGYGNLAVIFAEHEQEALDIAVDDGYMDGEIVYDEDGDEVIYAGNAGEPVDSTYLWLEELIYNDELISYIESKLDEE